MGGHWDFSSDGKCENDGIIPMMSQITHIIYTYRLYQMRIESFWLVDCICLLTHGLDNFCIDVIVKWSYPTTTDSRKRAHERIVLVHFPVILSNSDEGVQEPSIVPYVSGRSWSHYAFQRPWHTVALLIVAHRGSKCMDYRPGAAIRNAALLID